MGSTIAIAVATAGLKVMIVSRDGEVKALSMVKLRLTQQVQNGELTEAEKHRILKNISGGADIEKSIKPDLVIETIIEDMDEKKKLFHRLDSLCPSGTLFATNTSSLSVEEISMATQRRDRFIGLHFFYPADKMKLLEIAVTPYTSQPTIDKARSFSQKIVKESVVVQDIPGFIVNRLLFVLINEAMHMAQENFALPEDIDKSMQLGLNWPMGPLRLADIIGLDICLRIMISLYERTGKDKKYKPSRLLIDKVKLGHFGKKTKRGFYSYENR